jgi:pimeloyl-ACP methyl ester carboxylesterase
MPLETRRYGTSGPRVVVLHGGPGAPGSAAPLARGLAGAFRVLEPLQRGSGGPPLTVARHVADLHQLVQATGGRPPLVGHSWGAMLALAYASAHPAEAGPLVLVGCGTFDPAARARLRAVVDERLDDDLKQRLACLRQEIADPDERLRVEGNLLLPIYSYEPMAAEPIAEACDARAHHETWHDMLRLQEEGVYPAAFAAIETPVLMLHGAADPHPGEMIRASLEPFLPQLEYHEWVPCGHYPWLERAVRDDFFALLGDWLQRQAG